MTRLDALLKAYKVLGAKAPYWTQGQGSNLSYKNKVKKRLWIKPSGFCLNEVNAKEDLVEIAMDRLPQSWIGLSESEYSESISNSKIDKNVHRPSMETGFHAVLEAELVFHFHSLVSILMSRHQVQNENWLKKNWNAGKIFFVEYETPGLDLTVKISEHPEGSLFFLHQHGVIIAGNDLSILDLWFEIEKKWMREFYHKDWPPIQSRLELLKKYRHGKLKVLFPDMAVFVKHMPEILEKNREGWQLKSPTEKLNSNLVDLWLATQILLEFDENLSELSQIEIQKITGLTTEQYRLLKKD